MLKWIKRIILLTMFVFAGVAVYSMAREQLDIWSTDAPEEIVRPLEPYKYEELPSYDMLIVQVDTENLEKRILRCQQRECAVESIPHSLSGDALSDGRSWYHYVKREDKYGNEILVLKRTWVGDRGSETIVEETPLVRPRDLYISPNGKKVAYWLDNISNSKGLTELWVYDSDEGETKLVAEKIVRPDVSSRVRWNRSGTALWFLSARSEKKENGETSTPVDFAVVDVRFADMQARFAEMDWEDLEEEADHAVMDINFTGSALAFYDRSELGTSYLVTVRDGAEPKRFQVPGAVTYIQWLEDDSIIYAVHDGAEFAFWKTKGLQHTPIARFKGVLRSAHGDTEGKYMAFVGQGNANESRMYVLDLSNALVKEQGRVPDYGEHLYLVHIDQPGQSREEAIAGLTTELTDAQLTAFVQSNLHDIVGATIVTPVRVVMTNSPNSIYVDYRFTSGTLERVLVTVKDAIHAEWEVRAKYESVAGEWQKIQGGGTKDPDPSRLYEWEEGLEQWILKQELEEETKK